MGDGDVLIDRRSDRASADPVFDGIPEFDDRCEEGIGLAEAARAFQCRRQSRHGVEHPSLDRVSESRTIDSLRLDSRSVCPPLFTAGGGMTALEGVHGDRIDVHIGSINERRLDRLLVGTGEQRTQRRRVRPAPPPASVSSAVTMSQMTCALPAGVRVTLTNPGPAMTASATSGKVRSSVHRCAASSVRFVGEAAARSATGVVQSPSSGRVGARTSICAANSGATRPASAVAKARASAVCRSSGVTRTEYSGPDCEDESGVIFALMTRRMPTGPQIAPGRHAAWLTKNLTTTEASTTANAGHMLSKLWMRNAKISGPVAARR